MRAEGWCRSSERETATAHMTRKRSKSCDKFVCCASSVYRLPIFAFGGTALLAGTSLLSNAFTPWMTTALKLKIADVSARRSFAAMMRRPPYPMTLPFVSKRQQSLTLTLLCYWALISEQPHFRLKLSSFQADGLFKPTALTTTPQLILRATPTPTHKTQNSFHHA